MRCDAMGEYQMDSARARSLAIIFLFFFPSFGARKLYT